MSPFADFLQDVLDEVAASLDLTFEELTVDWVPGAGWVEPSRGVPPRAAGWMRTAAGWVPLDRQGGSE